MIMASTGWVAALIGYGLRMRIGVLTGGGDCPGL
ncbi:MAG: hypothetical protein JWM40_2586, partial [Frankiales bacterium]|nr:hypothetical protein [Frankiales bacterium]